MCLSHCKVVGGCSFHGIIDADSEVINLDTDDSADLMHSVDTMVDHLPFKSFVSQSILSPSSQPLSIISVLSQLTLPVLSQSHSKGGTSALGPFKAAGASKMCPCITRQLDPLWMEDLKELAAKEVESQKADECRKLMAQTVQHHFIIY